MRRRFKTCRRAFELMCEEEVQPRLSNAAALRGSMIHVFLYAWKRTGDTKKAWKATEKYLKDHMKALEKYYSVEELAKIDQIESLVKGVCRALPSLFGSQLSKLVEVEYFMKAPIPGLEGDFSVYAGTADAIMETKQGYWILDYKTKTSLHNKTHDWLRIDQQSQGYNWLLRQLIKSKEFAKGKRKKPVLGVVWVAIVMTRIRHKKGQTLEAYLEELEQVYLENNEKYFKKISVTHTDEEVEEFEQELYQDALSIQESSNRTRNTSQCLGYGFQCSYLPLCTDGWTRVNKNLFEHKPPTYFDEKVSLDHELE